MSGGEFDYMYARVEETYKGEFEDAELNEMLIDFCNLLYELEWWKSGDTDKEQYMECLAEFKKKWIRGYQDNEAQARIDKFKEDFRRSLEEQFSKL